MANRHLWVVVLFSLSFGTQAAQSSSAESINPSFSCHQARTQVENWICSDAGVARQDFQMARYYRVLFQRLDEDPELLRAQRAWLRERNACEDIGCVAAAYTERTAELEQRLNHVPDLGDFPWETAPAGNVHRIESINDTHLLRFTLGPADQHETYQWEFYPDPNDHQHSFDLNRGPYTDIVCRPPDAREGYAARFDYRDRRSDLAIMPITRGEQSGFRLMTMRLGDDLPLNETAACAFLFRGWLLDRPSVLYRVPVSEDT